MIIDELRETLRLRKAMIVHFSNHSNMHRGVLYPADLQQVLIEKERWALSCSVITPSHEMAPVGSIGVVLEPRTAEDVLRVHYEDVGAYSVGDSSVSGGEPLSQASLDASIDRVAKGSYNERRVQGAEPVGLFIVDPDEIRILQQMDCEEPSGPATTTGPGYISLDDVRTTFPGWKIWTMRAAGPVLI